MLIAHMLLLTLQVLMLPLINNRLVAGTSINYTVYQNVTMKLIFTTAPLLVARGIFKENAL